MRPTEQSITDKIKKAYNPVGFEIINESDNHSGPKGRESHFKVLIISDHFKSKTRVQRQREVMDLLDTEITGGVHALSLRVLTEEEAHKKGFETPNCSHQK